MRDNIDLTSERDFRKHENEPIIYARSTFLTGTVAQIKRRKERLEQLERELEGHFYHCELCGTKIGKRIPWKNNLLCSLCDERISTESNHRTWWLDGEFDPDNEITIWDI